MKIEVPFFSQRAADVPEEWHHRACGIAALHMALAAKKGLGDISTPALIEEGLSADAYMPTVGWKHDGLLGLSEAHGVHAHRQEFGTRIFPWRVRTLLAPTAHWFAGSGLRALRRALDRGVIPIVSLTTDTADTHLVVLTGYEVGTNSMFYYNDPAKDEENGADRSMDTATFAKRWRQMALFIG